MAEGRMAAARAGRDRATSARLHRGQVTSGVFGSGPR